jgi:hypothetical protein
MGKAADNERIKLRATFFNNIAVGLSITGVLVPYLAFIQSGVPDEHIMFDALRSGNIGQYEPLGLKFLAMFLAFASAAIFRHGANTAIAKLQD